MALDARRSDDYNKTREAILDAAEEIMREEGYGAVSSRKVALQAGLKSQLVHYYFGAMDELFLALFHRIEERHFARLSEAAKSKRPLHALWAFSADANGPRLTHEFMALATHRGVIRREIARSAERTRSVLCDLITNVFKAKGMDQAAWPPMVLAVLMAGAARLIVSEEPLDISLGHAETIAFVEQQLAMLEP